MFMKKSIRFRAAHAFPMLFFFSVLCFAQETVYRIDIVGINRTVHKNWLSIPKTADYTVYWDIYRKTTSGWTLADLQSLDRFRVICKSGSSVRTVDVPENYATFAGCRVRERYNFIIECVKNRTVVTVSDTAWVVTGRPVQDRQIAFSNRLTAQGPSDKSKWHHWFPFNGRIPLAAIGKGVIFDQSSNAGKVSFHLIWDFFLAGLVVWLVFCHGRLRLNKIFPMDKNTLVFHGLDENYKNRESKVFRNMLNDWRNRGTEVVSTLLNEIDDRNWDLYSTVRIVKAGLEKHNRMKDIHGSELLKDIERSIENRASSELEQLKRKTFVEWLWNLGTLAPLLGLFGTVTGISQSFGVLSSLQEDISQKELMNKLAGGIHEALWTTIEGLIVGICFMLLYYFYQTKLTWIYSKWEDIYTFVSEKL